VTNIQPGFVDVIFKGIPSGTACKTGCMQKAMLLRSVSISARLQFFFIAH